MSKGTVVIDNDNLDAVLADAHRFEPKPEVKEEPKKAEPKAEVKIETPKPDPEDDAEDENGLTAAEREGLTAKMQKAIGKKHRKLKEAEEFATEQFNRRNASEERAERLQRELEEFKKTKEPAKEAAQDSTPKREDFKNDQEYWEAVIDYRAEQKIKAKEAENQKQLQKEREAEVIAQGRARVQAAKELVPDFDEKMEALGENDRIPPHIGVYMQESELLPELAYHLASNLDVLKKLQTLSPHKALVEIGKIESTLKPFAEVYKPKAKEVEKPSNAETASNTASEPSKAKPRAPEPIVPINIGSASQLDKAPEQMSVHDNIRAVQKESGTNLLRRQRH